MHDGMHTMVRHSSVLTHLGSMCVLTLQPSRCAQDLESTPYPIPRYDEDTHESFLSQESFVQGIQ
jgi:hypothetical protein